MRDIFVDKLKGYACFWVVFGHVIMGIRLSGIEIPGMFYIAEKFIWSFHIYLFLFLSGYVYKITNEWRNKGTKVKFIKYKFFNLGIPYIFFSALYVLINSITVSANTQFAVSDILMIWKKPIAQYWFLYALLFLFFIWTVLSDRLKNWQITVLIAGLSYIVPLAGGRFEAFDVVFSSAAAFGLGTFSDLTYLKKCSGKAKILIPICHAALGIVLAYYDLTDKPFIKEIMMFFGIYSSIIFISFFEKNKLAGRFFMFMNKYSFQIYLLHTIFTAGIRIILVRLGINNWLVHIVCGCIFGIGMSVFAAYSAEKLTIFNFFFFPSKTVKKLKKKN